jgi:TolA-binding protein
MIRLLVLVIAAGLLPGCFWGGDDSLVYGRDDGRTLRDRLDELPELAVEPRQSGRPTREEVMAAWSQVHGLLPSPEDNQVVGKRMADLALELALDADADGVVAPGTNPYAPAVQRYQGLLESGVNKDRDQVLYQLARSLELAGDNNGSVATLDQLLREYPQSHWSIEARFRRGETHFSNGRYGEAAQDYAAVVAAGEDNALYPNALYMLGWAEFKESRLDEGLDHFFTLIGDLRQDDTDLTRAETELLNDTLRVVVLTLEYLDGAATLAERMERLELPAWQHEVYARLASDYVERQRFLDGVNTWSLFVEHNPLDARAPYASQEMIRILEVAGFPSEILPRKQEFVVRFGVRSDFWAMHGADVREAYAPTLKEYLGLLATEAHSAVQKKAAAGQAQAQDYLRAARWYEESLQTFPADASAANNLFLLGELYTEAGDHGRAVPAYQQVMREHPGFDKAADAGYAAVLGLTAIKYTANNPDVNTEARALIAAQIEFAETFPQDSRAPAVQGAAADGLFAAGDFSGAVVLATGMLQSFPAADPALRQTAMKIVGHGRFETGDFAGAEGAYRDLLKVTPEDAAQIQERLLASVYRQGEQAEGAGDVDTAAGHYLRLREIDAASEVAIRGQFDAVALRELQGDAVAAATLLEDLRNQHPEHELVQDAGLRLASMHEGSGNQAAAAAELSRLADEHTDSEVRRQSRYRAAEILVGLGRHDAAADQLTRYIDTFASPVEQRFEALHMRDALYEGPLAARAGNRTLRRQGWQTMVTAHQQAASTNTARTTMLAAEARYQLALEHRHAFDAITLQAPLAESLKRKQQALRTAIHEFEEVAAYNVPAQQSAATFQIADLYSALAKSVMASERPAGLAADELEQYEILLEEEAFPFEEQAITLHEINMQRSWDGVYDDWVKRSFAELKRLLPARFDKQEIEIAYVENIH